MAINPTIATHTIQAPNPRFLDPFIIQASTSVSDLSSVQFLTS